MTSFTTGYGRNAGPNEKLWANGPGPIDVSGPQGGRPVSNMTTDALVGPYTKNYVLEFIRHWKLSPAQEFLLSEVMPEVDSGEALEIAWTYWKFERDVANLTPEETASGLVSGHAHKKSVSLVRLGKAAQCSIDIMETDEGRRVWDEKIATIGNTFKQSKCLDAVRTIVAAAPFRTTLLMRQTVGTVDKPYQLSHIFDRETRMFGCLNKSTWSIDDEVSIARRVLQERGVTADVVLMPPGSKRLYLNSEENNVNRSTWQIEGQKGVDRQEQYLYQNELGMTIQGLQAVEMSAFVHPEDPMLRIDAMTRTVNIGMKHILSRHNFGKAEKGIYVQNIDTDNFEFISTMKAFTKSRIFMTDKSLGVGNWRILPKMRTYLDSLFFPNGNVSENFSDIKDINGYVFDTKLNDTDDAGNKVELKWTEYSHWLRIISLGGSLPLNFMVLRPRIEFDMASAVVMQKGSATCQMFSGYGNAMIGKDVVKGVVHANVTLRCKATVAYEDHIEVLPNVQFQRYRGGGNLKDMFGDNYEIDFTDETKLAKSLKEMVEIGMDNVRNLSNGISAPAAIYLAVPIQSTAQAFSFVDLFGNLEDNPVLRIAQGPVATDYNPQEAFGTSEYYVDFYGLKKLFPPQYDFSEMSNCDLSEKLGVTTMFQGFQVSKFLDSEEIGIVESRSHITNDLSMPKSRDVMNGQSSAMRVTPIKDWNKLKLLCQ